MILSLVVTARCYAERGIATASRLSVRLSRLSARSSVTLRYRDRTGWNYSNMISSCQSATTRRLQNSDLVSMVTEPRMLHSDVDRYIRCNIGLIKFLVTKNKPAKSTKPCFR